MFEYSTSTQTYIQKPDVFVDTDIQYEPPVSPSTWRWNRWLPLKRFPSIHGTQPMAVRKRPRAMHAPSQCSSEKIKRQGGKNQLLTALLRHPKHHESLNDFCHSGCFFVKHTWTSRPGLRTSVLSHQLPMIWWPELGLLQFHLFFWVESTWRFP